VQGDHSTRKTKTHYCRHDTMYHHLSAFEFTPNLSRVKSYFLEWKVL